MSELRVDQIVLICNGCKGERLYYPNPVLVGSAAIDQWLKTKVLRCKCGAQTCDARMRTVPVVTGVTPIDIRIGSDAPSRPTS